MKKLLLCIGAAGLIFTGGCKKFLDKEPDNRTHITTADQLSQLLTTAYPQANYIMFMESMTDNAEDKNGGGTGADYIDRINRQAYRYEVIEATPDNEDSPDFYWNACYHAIAAANQALQIIDASPNKAQLTAQRGEALLTRAYCHFMLVALFSKAYDPATAASDPGIPYVTTPEKLVLAKYERRTVAYVYEMIEKDLKEGSPLIDERIYGTAPKFHFNRQAAGAFGARFYMFKREYTNAVAYATLALPGAPADNLRPWNTTLTTLQYQDLAAAYGKSTTRGNLLLQESVSDWARFFSRMRYGLGINVVTKLYNNPNVSGSYYAYPVYGSSTVYNIPKFYENFVTENINATIGIPYTTIPLLTAEEAVLSRAEAYARLGNKAAAVSDINAFLSQNIDQYQASTDSVNTRKAASYYQTSDTTGALVSAALDQKRAFFVLEGIRWLDILRLKIPVTHTTSAGEVITLGPDDKRRALQLPNLTKQAGLAPNIR